MIKKGFKHSEKTKRKISRKLKGTRMGDENPAKRLDVREKIRQSKIGKISPKKGKSFEELYGIKRASNMKKRMSIQTISQNVSRENNPNWKGGKMLNSGYIYIRLNKKKYPNLPTYRGYIKRANFIWYKNTREIIKYPYILHHKNDNKTNDNFSNLLKITQSKHALLNKKRNNKNGRFV
jgi:hypothetical protein